MFCVVCGGDLVERDGGVFHVDGKNPWCPIGHTDMALQCLSNIESAAAILDSMDFSQK